MTTLSRVEKVRLSKRAKRIKLTRTGAISTMALGLAGCVQASAAAAYKVPETINQEAGQLVEKKQTVSVVKKESPYYLYSIYENDDLNQEVKVYGFKNTTEESKSNPIRSDKTEYTANNETTKPSINHKLAPAETNAKASVAEKVDADVAKKEKEVVQEESTEIGEEKVAQEIEEKEVDQREMDSEEPVSEENNGLEDEQTASNEEETTAEEKNEPVDQEQPQAAIQWNNHGKVLYVEDNRFALETEDGPKWFVNNGEKSINKIEPGMAVSVYFVVAGEENQLINYFITYIPDKGDLSEFIEANFLHYASEEKRAIVVYIPHQQVIFDLSEQVQTQELEQEFANGDPIMLNTIKQEDGSILVKSITARN
ncbi:hypothetical protein JOC54_002543 [Alkalihalobacillus xiaoxiensis]|uniref:Uncharacterized protein n=1 Tax=Shouchella xiaoxiensis TaxID=766895 RepID=A0ABS2SUU2_9BACI|nr:hypothetical protein [Shouchella xiaoxiensis]MBM7839272.1 hypothetical protein [Shouchella xiaoxiensis]